MLVFEKIGSESKTGWDANKKTQTLQVGNSTEVALRADAGGDMYAAMASLKELSVAVVGIWGAISDDCTIHELPRVSALVRKFVITALKPGTVEIQAGDHLGEAGATSWQR